MSPVLALLLACGGDDGDGRPTDDTATTLPTTPPSFVTGPAFRPNDRGDARLVGFLSFTTSEPTTASIEVEDGRRVYTVTVDTPATEHDVRMLGLRPAAHHVYRVTVTTPDGRQATAPDVTFDSDPLPEDFPPITLESSVGPLEPGVTLIGLAGWVMMVDATGEPCWYVQGGGLLHQIGLTARGNVYWNENRDLLREVDLNGAVVHEWHATGSFPDGPGTPVPVEVLHHDLFEMPSGNWLGMSIERRWLDYPPSEYVEQPLEPAWVAGDVIVEFTPDGAVVNEWPLLDLLDPQRIGYSAVTGDYWNEYYGEDVNDWSHGNSVWYDEARDEVIVSLRHQDAVIAIARATGELAWMMAPPEGWVQAEVADVMLVPDPLGTTAFYHQHSAKLTPSGTLMLFDNGNFKATPFDVFVRDEDNFSRAVEIAFDHAARRWELVWKWETTFSGSYGDVDPLPVTGNVLVTRGNVWDPDLPGVIVTEVDHAIPPNVLWEISAPQPLTTFRAERVDGIIPGR